MTAMHCKPEFNGRSVADSAVLFQGLKGRYKRPLTSRDLIGLWKEKRYRRNMMFLFAGHSAGLLSKNFVKQSFTKFLESKLHGSQRKSYLSAPFFFYLRYGWLVRGRLYMPIYVVNCTTESVIYVMELTVMGWVPIGLKLNLHSWNKWIRFFNEF